MFRYITNICAEVTIPGFLRTYEWAGDNHWSVGNMASVFANQWPESQPEYQKNQYSMKFSNINIEYAIKFSRPQLFNDLTVKEVSSAHKLSTKIHS